MSSIALCLLWRLVAVAVAVGVQSTEAIVLRELQQGNYVSKRRLRRHDELKPIHNALQRLAASLRDKDA